MYFKLLLLCWMCSAAVVVKTWSEGGVTKTELGAQERAPRGPACKLRLVPPHSTFLSHTLAQTAQHTVVTPHATPLSSLHSMGGAPSKAPSFAPVPTRFGAVDGLGPVRGISRVVDDKGAPCFIAVRPEALDSFSAITADRRKRIRRRGITATASRVDTVYGHVVFVGTADGEVALYDASSLECFKTFAVEGGAGSGGVSVRRAAVTALAPIAKDTLFVGTADGLVRAFSVSKGEAVKLYEGSGSDSEAGADGDAVTGLAAYGIAGGPSMLAVGHRDGRVDSFDVASGSLLLALNAGRGGLSQLLWLSRFNCLATVHSGVNTMTVWDIEVDRCLTLDFSSELASISRSCKLTAAEYDDARGGECLLLPKKRERGGEEGVGDGTRLLAPLSVSPCSLLSHSPLNSPVLSLLSLSPFSHSLWR